ncbi:unnamed protein product [Mytilus edulis]|uniref:Uncharacterized protein n=1 Tax=Mytilus edulis TaxID=6550 RepID=A0A8S3QYQ4_MYTED|nr:unnamed protein product [Mytilus edulis]
MRGKTVLSACTGSGFPAEWTTATAGVTYWFVTEAIKRQFTSSYTITDYQTSDGSAYGSSPTCEDEYYDPSTGYYYYLMLYSGTHIYSTDTSSRQLCQAFKQFDSVIREYYEDLGGTGVLAAASTCASRFTSSTSSFALTKYNYQYVNCPFSFETYYFTFSSGGNADYCSSSQSSVAPISDTSIALKSCYDFNLVSNANPFYGAFNCLGSWSAESRDTPSRGDFIVMEMYDSSPWPYCGINKTSNIVIASFDEQLTRYKVGSDGAITLSLYLSMSEDTFFPVFCDATKDNEYYYESGATKYVRMHFTPVNPWTTQEAATDVTTDSMTTIDTTIGQTTIDSVTTTTTEATTTNVVAVTQSTTTTTATTTAAAVASTVSTGSVVTTGNSTGNASVSSSNSSFLEKLRDLYWPWWILVASAVLTIMTLFICLLVFARKRKKRKVETLKKSKDADPEVVEHHSKAPKTKTMSRNPFFFKGKSNGEFIPRQIRVKEFEKPIIDF